MKRRLIAGTINHWADDAEWANYHLDISDRGVWSRDLETFVKPDFVTDIAAMIEVPAETFDEVRAHHVLEHLKSDRVEVAIEEVRRVLKPGGVFDVEVPDVGKVCLAYADGDLDLAGLRQWLYGETLAEHETADSHFSAFTAEWLAGILADHGFEPGDEIDAGHAARFRAVKP